MEKMYPVIDYIRNMGVLPTMESDVYFDALNNSDY